MPRLLAAVGLAMILMFGGLQPAAASCAVPVSLSEQIRTSPLVFVGTVVYTSDGDRVAHVEVESIWKGPRLPAYVDVHGSPVSGPFTYSSVDRTYRQGSRYLFILYSTLSPLQDNDCSGTRLYTSDLAAYAPGGAQRPLAATFGDQAQNFVVAHVWLLGAAIALVVATLAAVTWLRLRRRSPNALR